MADQSAHVSRAERSRRTERTLQHAGCSSCSRWLLTCKKAMSMIAHMRRYTEGGTVETRRAEHAERASLPISMHAVKRTWYDTSPADWRLRSKWIITG